MVSTQNTPTHKEFRVVKDIEIQEQNCRLVELIHEPTGALVLHIANDDPENVFCLGFRTLPESSNGVAHILEHTVLCGSKRFPVKDPFFAMTRRSLNTFMNAFTGSDYTLYPAASQVKKDFYNLLDVYMDACFHPCLREYSFLQEGHRLEIEEGKLQHGGIVFNEMKGAMSSPDSRLWQGIQEELYPDLIYANNSGGDPAVIPSLTYQELLDFHKRYYHPSRCLFFFYGNLPLEEHLDFIQEKALKGQKALEPIPPIPRQKRFTESKTCRKPYPAASGESLEKQTQIAFSYLTCPVEEQLEILALSVIEIALMGTDASPLKLQLLRSGLCTQASIFMDSDMSEVPVILLMRGTEEKHLGPLEALITKCLKSIVEEGLPSSLIESALHQLEFHKSEITGDGFPHGLNLFMRAGILKMQNQAPEYALSIHSLFQELRERIEKNGRYIEELIQKHFLDNSHQVKLILYPDPDLSEREEREEADSLKKQESTLSEKDKQTLIERSDALEKFQDEQELQDIEVLPKVTLDDVPTDITSHPIEKVGKALIHPCFTNQIVYCDLVFDLADIAQEDLSLARLFTYFLPQLGAAGQTYVQTLERAIESTGGIGMGLGLNLQAQDSKAWKPSIYIEGKALYRKAGEMFSLLKDLLVSADFSDEARIKELITKHYTALQSSLTDKSLGYAIKLSAKSLGAPQVISNHWSGLDYYLKVKGLVEKWDGSLIPELMRLQKTLLTYKNPELVLACDQAFAEKLAKDDYYGLLDLEEKPHKEWKGQVDTYQGMAEARVIPAPVAFTGMAMPTVPYAHEDASALAVLSNILDNHTLHPRIREQGGAYGGGSICNALSGTFVFFARRDPNLSETVKAFKESIDQVLQGKYLDRELEEAKLEVIQSLDSPTSPGSRSINTYDRLRTGRTDAFRRDFRKRTLSLTRERLENACKTHIAEAFEKAQLVSFAGKELLERENPKLKKALTISHI